MKQPVNNVGIESDAVPVDDLARLARSGDSHAFNVLTLQLRPRVLVAIRKRIGGHLSDAEDVVQDSFVKAWKNIQTYDQTRSFTAWFYTIAFRTATDHLRSQKRRVHHTRQLSLNTSTSETAQSTLHNNENAANIWSRAKELLTDQQYVAMWLRYAEDFSVGDVAKTMGKTQVATRVLLHRARARLHAFLMSERNCCEE